MMLKKPSVLLFAILVTTGFGGYNADAEQTTSASNLSTPTSCAEEDNINIPISGNLQYFVIEATHPTYVVGSDNCTKNSNNCPTPISGYPSNCHPIPPQENCVFKLFDDHETVIEAVQETEWWLPNGGMIVSVDNESALTDIHYVRVYRKIADAEEWPQFFVFYADGNMRLIPHPPEGINSVCFGSSVLVGPAPAAPGSRPYAEIASVNYVSTSKILEVTYRSGGSASFDLKDVNRTKTSVGVIINYSTSVPFTTFRSMFVEEGNTDVDHVAWQDVSGTNYDDPVMTFPGGESKEWFFHRTARSIHNTSAPDINISATKALLTVSKAGTGSGTVNSVPAGIDCGNDCTEDYDNGTGVKLTATPASGSTFAGWDGACTPKFDNYECNSLIRL